mgnify:CR=1 FL=1
MLLEPYNWSVVILGAWNRAILTPRGTKEILFPDAELKDIEIAIPVDSAGPCRVTIHGVTVMAHGGRLAIETRENRLSALHEARQLGAKALEELPRTPVTAAGFNIKVKTDKLKNTYKTLLEAFPTPELESESVVKERLAKQSLCFREGFLNVLVREVLNQEYYIELNFHCDSKDPLALRSWLDIDSDILTKTVADMLDQIVDATPENIRDALCH